MAHVPAGHCPISFICISSVSYKHIHIDLRQRLLLAVSNLNLQEGTLVFLQSGAKALPLWSFQQQGTAPCQHRGAACQLSGGPPWKQRGSQAIGDLFISNKHLLEHSEVSRSQLELWGKVMASSPLCGIQHRASRSSSWGFPLRTDPTQPFQKYGWRRCFLLVRTSIHFYGTLSPTACLLGFIPDRVSWGNKCRI